MKLFCLAITCLFVCCSNNAHTISSSTVTDKYYAYSSYPKDSWQYFLQHLPVIYAPIKDYTGKPVTNQSKHFAIINYDVGTTDLQQCADALIRLRAEYLFTQNRFNEIGFHFCSGQFYSWSMYCKGIKPVINGSRVNFLKTSNLQTFTHACLRKYLDIVYAYASTISLCKELKPANDFETGTVIIFPGSPGHTCIIIDKKTNNDGEKLYKLAEGYMPAQSIYILSNPYNPSISPWYHLNKGEIVTASCDFISYQLKKFE